MFVAIVFVLAGWSAHVQEKLDSGFLELAPQLVVPWFG